MKVLQLTVHFAPNLGGVETHLLDLVSSLNKQGWGVTVLCYQPLSTKTSWKIIEKKEKLKIIRIPWLRGLFYKLISFPVLQFLYLFPGLFILTPIILLIDNPRVIHAHGIVSGLVAVLWGKLFGKRIIISTHSLYSFPKKGFYLKIAKFIFSQADKTLCLSEKSYLEILGLGVDKKRVSRFTYWIDLEKFKKNINAKKKYSFKEEFIVLFVGRLVPEKGIESLLESVKTWDKKIGLVFAGTGPLEKNISRASLEDNRIHFLGRIEQDSLPSLYSAADVVIVPSTSEEGFGRVIIESLACSTPVIASNKGSISEAMDESVGQLIEVTPENIKKSIENLFQNQNKIKLLAKNCRVFAERRYSEGNVQQIVNSYTK